MKLSEELKAASEHYKKYPIVFEKEFQLWIDYAGWLEGKLEDEGVWADRDQDRPVSDSSEPFKRSEEYLKQIQNILVDDLQSQNTIQILDRP